MSVLGDDRHYLCIKSNPIPMCENYSRNVLRSVYTLLPLTAMRSHTFLLGLFLRNASHPLKRAVSFTQRPSVSLFRAELRHKLSQLAWPLKSSSSSSLLSILFGDFFEHFFLLLVFTEVRQSYVALFGL